MAYTGFKHSEETKAKMRRAAVGRWGSRNGNWKGGRILLEDGYVIVLRHGHHRSDSAGYVYEHILVSEDMLGRRLVYISKGHGDNEVAHHQNEIKSDNRPENLRVMLSRHHTSLHASRPRKRKVSI